MQSASRKWIIKLSSKGEIQMVNKYFKKCLIPLVIRQTQIKTDLRVYYTPASISNIKKTNSNKCWWVCSAKKILITIGMHVNWCSHYGNKCGGFEKKIL